MRELGSLDLSILAAYFILTMAVGLLMTRRASSSLEHYFLGGRTLPWYLLGIAGMTSWFDMTGTMIITSFLYLLGPRGLYIEFRGGAVLILAFLLVYAGKWHRRSGCMTFAEWMTYRFGEGKAAVAVRVLIAASVLLGTVAALAYLVRGCSLFMGQALPFPPLYTTIAILAISTLYTMFAGFYGVVLTDLLQGGIILVSCVVVGLMAWFKVPDAATFGALAVHVSGNPDWMTSLPSRWTALPPGYAQYQPLLLLASFYLLRNVLAGMGSGAENRYFGARSDRDCGLQSLLQGLTVALRWPMMMGFTVLGIYLVAHWYPDQSVVGQAAALLKTNFPGTTEAMWHELTARIAGDPQAYPGAVADGLRRLLGDSWQAKLALVGFHGTINPEQILPAVLLGMPAGLKGAMLVALLAAMMSTLTGTVNGAGALFVKDIYQLLMRPRAANRELIIVSYGSTVVLVALSLWMGYAAQSINDIWGWIIMGLGAGGLAPGLLRLYWWRCNAWGVVGGTVLGGVGAALQRIYAPEMPEIHQFILMTMLSFVGTIGGSLLTAPTPMPRLRHFYETTRPFGLWGPVKATFAAPRQGELTREHTNDVLAIPFVLLWQVTLFLLPMQFVIKAYDSFWRTLPLFLLGCAGLYWFWYRVLPPREAPPAQRQPELAAARSDGGAD